jgi:hypothetical protein
MALEEIMFTEARIIELSSKSLGKGHAHRFSIGIKMKIFRLPSDMKFVT